jgi:hypothetical protein
MGFNIARMYPLADLPNAAGFAFVGILKDGTRVDCHVIKDPSTSLHRVAGAPFSDLRGWVKK